MNEKRMDEWVAKSDMGEYVMHTASVNGVMAFSKNPDDALRTTDSYEAAEWCRIARELYGRRGFHIAIVD